MAQAILKLEKAASRNGGDKYSGQLNGEDVQFYVPQSISRPAGTAVKEIKVTVEVN